MIKIKLFQSIREVRFIYTIMSSRSWVVDVYVGTVPLKSKEGTLQLLMFVSHEGVSLQTSLCVPRHF